MNGRSQLQMFLSRYIGYTFAPHFIAPIRSNNSVSCHILWPIECMSGVSWRFLLPEHLVWTLVPHFIVSIYYIRHHQIIWLHLFLRIFSLFCSSLGAAAGACGRSCGCCQWLCDVETAVWMQLSYGKLRLLDPDRESWIGNRFFNIFVQTFFSSPSVGHRVDWQNMATIGHPLFHHEWINMFQTVVLTWSIMILHDQCSGLWSMNSRWCVWQMESSWAGSVDHAYRNGFLPQKRSDRRLAWKNPTRSSI